MRDIEDLKKEFENFKIEDSCIDGSCDSDIDDLKDYPNYTEALYAKIASPNISGVYLSRWDLKYIALEAGESMAIHPRKRMFELLMKYATTKENMRAVLNALEKHILEKVEVYQEMIEAFPSSAEIFNPKIEKAQKTVGLFPKILDEYFE